MTYAISLPTKKATDVFCSYTWMTHKNVLEEGVPDIHSHGNHDKNIITESRLLNDQSEKYLVMFRNRSWFGLK